LVKRSAPTLQELTMTIARTDTQPTAVAAPLDWRARASLFGHLMNRWIADVIARREQEAARVALCRFGDRNLKDIGVDRCRIGDAGTAIARERTRLQACRQSR
jgi:uncharacterized protein YjiS (DUF1127 family)